MAILFDIDGTLVDHASAAQAGLSALCSELGLAASASCLVEWRRISECHFRRHLDGLVSFDEQRRARVRELAGFDLSDVRADVLFGTYLGVYESNWRLFPDARDCLDRLRDHQLGVISNGDGAQQRAKLQATGVADLFDVIVVSGEVGTAKPNPEIFVAACRELCVPMSGAVYVGDDRETDALAARRSGLAGIWVNRVRADGPSDGVMMVHSLTEVPDLMNGLEVGRRPN
jgi:putative hydrolase of the HAD superfamily